MSSTTVPPAPPSPSVALAKEGFAPSLRYFGLRWTLSTSLFPIYFLAEASSSINLSFSDITKYHICAIMWYVYILRCRGDLYYTGCTNNIDERIDRHKKGHIHFTRSRLPVALVSYCAFKDKYNAFEFERYLKTGSGKAFAKRHFL